MNIRDELIQDEGLELKPYADSTGNLTIGVGRNLDGRGITHQEAMYLLDNDIAECLHHLGNLFHGWLSYSTDRRNALTNMRFNLGPYGFMGFKKMISAIRAGKWQEAADECLDSGAARMLPGRYGRIAARLKDSDLPTSPE